MKIIITLLLMAAGVVHAACPHLYPYNKPIHIPGAVELCNEQYVALYDEHNRAVLLVSELILAQRHNITRVSRWTTDKRVNNPVKTTEYLHTGYDRGHMAPADSATSIVQMNESHLMTNVTPQDPTLNSGRWRALESRIQRLIEQSGTNTHVVTVAVYKDREPANNIPVPYSYIKTAYLASGTVAFTTLNNAVDKVQKISMTEANKMIKFASLPK